MSAFDPHSRPDPGWRAELYTVLFETETSKGRAFDAVLLAAILVSVSAVCLETVDPLYRRFAPVFESLEWMFTGLFAVEYCLRLASVRRPRRYALSFFGVVDLISILPTIVGLFVADAHSLRIIRALRLMRVFRVLKLGKFLRDAQVLRAALVAARYKIVVFMVAVLNLVLMLGALMYLVEGPEHGFSSIPKGIYWAIVTMTTVGYGDIAPQTTLGQVIASGVMLLGYGILAVPTGIVSVELSRVTLNESAEERVGQRACACGMSEDDSGANYCRRCGERLPDLR
ncbi:MAG: ion transporter [Nannocystaceae bacterium]